MTIKLDVLLVQIIHILILFRVFRKLIGDSLSNALAERKNKIQKLENADAEYARMLSEGQIEAERVIKEGLQRKEEIITEAALLAKKRADEIVSLAEKQSERIQNEATQKAANLEKELKDGFVDGVRNTTKLIVNKLVNDDVALQNTYIDGLVQEFVGGK